MPKKKIIIVPYNPNWPKIFETHAKELRETLGKNCLKVYHVGADCLMGHRGTAYPSHFVSVIVFTSI